MDGPLFIQHLMESRRKYPHPISALRQSISSSSSSSSSESIPAANITYSPASSDMSDAAVAEIPVGTSNEELGSIIQQETASSPSSSSSFSSQRTIGYNENDTASQSRHQYQQLGAGGVKFTPTVRDRHSQRQDPSQMIDDTKEQERRDREAKQARSIFLSDADLLSVVDL
ncbi:hypothetical protein BDF22DRAFT_653820 [Syncephalis plumigaleata]|nr:hypothetical protein BDF22DRAFT_653820 [Syncephalis plumigaleata]